MLCVCRWNKRPLTTPSSTLCPDHFGKFKTILSFWLIWLSEGKWKIIKYDVNTSNSSINYLKPHLTFNENRIPTLSFCVFLEVYQKALRTIHRPESSLNIQNTSVVSGILQIIIPYLFRMMMPWNCILCLKPHNDRL